MTERKAVYYGQVELIPGIVCDGYVLDDDTAVMSERGAADLLGMNQMALNRVKTNWPPKTLEPFIDKGLSVKTTEPPKVTKPFVSKGLSVGTTLVEVVAKNSPHKGRKIVVYNSNIIETIIRAYVMAAGHNALQKNQFHVGKRCSILVCALTRTALEASIKEACGLSPNIQQTVQKNYIDAVKLIKDFGFTCSAPNDIAIKKDITQFLDVPKSTLNSFLRKHKSDIEPIQLDTATIRSIGGKASRMNGYSMDDVSKIALGMDSVVGIELKKKVFGQVGSFVKQETSVEIQWREVLSKVFEGFDLRFNYPIDSYKVDFFVAKLLLVLECNGYCHRYYDEAEEKVREKLITQRYSLVRFHHFVSLETLFNGILQAKPGTVITLYNLEQLGQEMPFNINPLAVPMA
jgi:very-short-patch-repair endonuclease